MYLFFTMRASIVSLYDYSVALVFSTKAHKSSFKLRKHVKFKPILECKFGIVCGSS
jgi:Ca2+/H+ antiporter